MLIRVVLPDPLGPSNPKMRPLGTLSDSPSTASTRPYRLVNSSVWITASLIAFSEQPCIQSTPLLGRAQGDSSARGSD